MLVESAKQEELFIRLGLEQKDLKPSVLVIRAKKQALVCFTACHLFSSRVAVAGRISLTEQGVAIRSL